MICDIVAKVHGGSLEMVSPLSERGNPNGRRGAVIGGTGRYTGARGYFDDEVGRSYDTNTVTLLR
jgi:hypothetical protein